MIDTQKKQELTLKIKEIFDKKLAKIKSEKFKEYEEKLQLSTDFFDLIYDELKKEYKGLNGKKILETIEMMLKNLKMTDEEANKTERTMTFIGKLNWIIEFICDILIYIALGVVFAYLSKLVVVAGMTLEAIYIGFGILIILYALVYPILSFIENVLCGVILAPIIEETSKLIYTNRGLITKYIQMFNLDENMGYYIYKDPNTKEIYYDVDTGIYRMRTQCMHIISSYVIKSKYVANSKIMSYITAIGIHAIFNLTAIIPGIIGFKLWKKYSDHLVSKYGDLLDEYRSDIAKLNKVSDKKVKVKESINRVKYYKKVIRCYQNVQFI